MSSISNATPPIHIEPVLEVAQTVGDAVDSVHILSADDAPPRVSRRVLAAIGLAFLLVSALAFARSVSVSADNERAYQSWVEVDRKPVADFRPVRLSLVHDALAFGGLAAALFCFGAALAVRRRLSSVVTAGESEADAIAWAGQPSFELARVTSGAATISLPPEAVATVTSANGERREVRGQLVLAQSESAMAGSGLGTVRFSWTAKPRRAAIAALSLDSRTSKFIAASALAHLAILALLMQIPPDARTMDADADRYIHAISRMTADAAEDKIVPPEPGEEPGESGKVAVGIATSSTQGDKGSPTATKDKTRAQIKRRSESPRLVQGEGARFTEKDAREFGIAGLLRESHFTSLTSNAPFASGVDLDDMIGTSFSASDLGEGRGVGGPWGSPDGKGVSPYGGDWGTIASSFPPGGRISGDSSGEDFAGKFGGDGTRKHISRRPIIKPRPASCGVAGCNKELIGRYIRKHKRQIRNCYERALIGDNELAGTVLSRFLIHPDGKVSSSRASGIGNSDLESCVARVVSSIQFPVVADGALASVSYPFVLSVAGK